MRCLIMTRIVLLPYEIRLCRIGYALVVMETLVISFSPNEEARLNLTAQRNVVAF